MKQCLILLFLFALLSCKKENTPNINLNEKVDLTVAIENSKGKFSNGPYGTSSGTAKIYTINNEKQLGLENFSSSNGPSLYVYLSNEKEPLNFISLGSLKSTTGNQLYAIPNTTNTKAYKYVLIYCKQYSHLFGIAELN